MAGTGGSRDFEFKVHSIERQICREFEKDNPQWETLKDLAKQGDVILRQWLKFELEFTDHTMLRNQDMKDVDHIEDQPQHLLSKTADGLLAAGVAAQECFEEAVEKLRKDAGLVHADIVMGPLKGRTRLVEKMAQLETSGKHSCAVFDMNRATVLCMERDHWTHVLIALGKFFGAQMKMRNKFNIDWNFISEPPCLFYQVCLRNVFGWMEPGKYWVVELQITTHQILQIKHYSHLVYEILRADSMPQQCVVCQRPSPGLAQRAGQSLSPIPSSIPDQMERKEMSSGSKICIVGGGLSARGGLNSLHVFDCVTKAWSIGPDMQSPRSFVGVTALQGNIYAVGGKNDRELATVERYSVASCKWENVALMNIARSGAGVAVLPDGKLYVAGGFSGRDGLSTAERFDPSTGRMRPREEGEPLLTKRRYICYLSTLGILFELWAFITRPLSSLEKYQRTKVHCT